MQTGWLSPNGEFYPCATFDHIEVAEDIISKVGIQANGVYHPDDVLMSAGWVHITRSSLGMKEQNVFWDKFLTEHQKRFLKPYFEENDEPVSDVAKARWEYEVGNI